jgi:aromatic-L-amino-acid/L-tryptophan decarboxylase
MSERPLPPAVASLFPVTGERERVEEHLTRALSDALERVAQGPVVPTLDMDAFRRELADFDFGAPRRLDVLLAWTIAQLEHGTVHMTHPRYLGLFNPAPSFPAECADRIVAAFNPQLASSGSSPVPVELEAHVVRAMAARAGLPPGSGGHFATGGSEANFTALISALTRAAPGFAEDGVRAFPGPATMYTSREAHLGWLKFAHQAGIGRRQLRLVATDGRGRLDPAALAALIAADRANGSVPVLISASAGTTGAGMVDPLSACAEIARANGLWYHVDAAWGGAALCSERLRGELAGIELADSVTIDAHKWFATTMGCAMYLTREPGVLAEAFHASTSFMPTSLASIDPYLTTVQWSRRFLGLRLFLSLAAAGWSGYAAHVERAVEVIARIRSGLEARGWTIANDSRLAVLCALPPARLGEVRALVRRVVASGVAWVAPVSFEGRDVVRVCATHGGTTQLDIDRVVAALDAPG